MSLLEPVSQAARDGAALHLTRRRLLARGAALGLGGAMLGTLLAACADDDDVPAPAAPDDDAAEDPDVDDDTDDDVVADADDDARRGGTLRVGHSLVPANIDPNIHGSRFAARISIQIFDCLINEYQSGEYEPGLAETWEVSDDLLEYTLHLREGVTFHDGEPFNAEAVHGTFQRILDPDSASLRTFLDDLDFGEVVDEFTYRMNMERATAVTVNNLSSVGAAPGSMAAVERLGDEYLRSPVGTGPFRVLEWPGPNELVLERNPDYAWAPPFLENQGTAYVDQIHYFFVEEATTRIASLESGDTDIIDDPPDIEVERLQESDDYDVIMVKTAGLPQSAFLNITVPPTEELAVRQAMLYGVDRETSARLIFHGAQTAAYGPLSSASWAYWDGLEEMYPHDPDRAVELLEEAGWEMGADGVREKDGQRLRTRHITTAGTATQFAEFIQGSLREIGFDYIVETMDLDGTLSRQSDNDYEVGRLGLSSSDPHGALYGAWHSSQVTGGSQYNRSRVADPYVDDLLDTGIATGDLDERREIYRDLQEYIMENAFMIPGWESHQYHVTASNVRGLKVNITESPYLHDVWLDQS
jgi:peptide/nickel transport system substrate-binding protein